MLVREAGSPRSMNGHRPAQSTRAGTATRIQAHLKVYRAAFLAFTLLVSIAVTGCRPQVPNVRASSTPPGTTVRTYETRGLVREIRKSGKVLITHEDIPGYMQAMTMEFEPIEPNALANVGPGDLIAFRLCVSDTRSWIDEVHTIAEAPARRPAPAGAATASQSFAGAELPDCLLLDQTGRALQLRDLKGRALALTFIFTRCPLPDYCPLMNQRLAMLQKSLTAAGIPNWHLLSVSIDPEYDTPERLAEYAQQFQPNPDHWTFATGSADEIERLATAFGLKIVREGAELNHNLRTVIVDAAGRVQRVFIGNDWEPAELIEEMKSATATAR